LAGASPLVDDTNVGDPVGIFVVDVEGVVDVVLAPADDAAEAVGDAILDCADATYTPIRRLVGWQHKR
jgi:hypothetical protein